MTFITKAAFLLSLHWPRGVSDESRKARGKVVGNPIDVSPLASVGRKSVKSGRSCNRPQPPLDPVMIPLRGDQPEAKDVSHMKNIRLLSCRTDERVSSVGFLRVPSTNKKRLEGNLLVANGPRVLENNVCALSGTLEVDDLRSVKWNAVSAIEPALVVGTEECRGASDVTFGRDEKGLCAREESEADDIANGQENEEIRRCQRSGRFHHGLFNGYRDLVSATVDVDVKKRFGDCW